MTVHGVSTVRNEADIVDTVIRHTFAQGIDRIWVVAGKSTDTTTAILTGLADEFPGRLTVYEDLDDYHYQPYWVTRLTLDALAAGADWVVPFDADEFWIAADVQMTVADALDGLPADVGVVRATMFQHHDMDIREVAPKPLTKVAFRPAAGVVVANGSHNVSGAAGRIVDGVLEVREVQYRGFEHFCRKIIERNASLDPTLPAGEGGHHKQLAGLSEAELRGVWDGMQARPTVVDPIPTMLRR